MSGFRPGTGRSREEEDEGEGYRRPTAENPWRVPRRIEPGPQCRSTGRVGVCGLRNVVEGDRKRLEGLGQLLLFGGDGAGEGVKVCDACPESRGVGGRELGQGCEGTLKVGQGATDIAVVSGQVGAHRGQIVGEGLVGAGVLGRHMTEIPQVVEESGQLRALGGEGAECFAQRGQRRVQRFAIPSEGVGRAGEETGQRAVSVHAVGSERPRQLVETVYDPVDRNRHRCA